MFVYSSNGNARNSGFGGIGCLIFGVLGMVAAWFILKGLFKLLYIASPVLFVLALVINWRAVTDTLKNWLQTMETNPIGGLFRAALAVLLFPVFVLYLFLKSLGYNKMQEFKRQMGQEQPLEEFTDFEELESIPKNEAKADEPLDLPDFPKQKSEGA